jgi:hypothetical protein
LDTRQRGTCRNRRRWNLTYIPYMYYTPFSYLWNTFSMLSFAPYIPMPKGRGFTARSDNWILNC